MRTRALYEMPPIAGYSEQIAAMFDRPIAFHRCLVDVANGSVTGALMLSQAIYWSRRTKNPEGWFYKSHKEWTEETGMSRREQDTAKKKLAAVLECDVRGVPATTHFRVNFVRLAESLHQWSRQFVEFPDPDVFAEAIASVAQKRQTGCTKAPNKNGGNRQTINTETTQEITSYSEKTDERLTALASLDTINLAEANWKLAERSLKAIVASTPSVTADEIRRRAANYETHFNVAITSSALAKWWGRCDRPKPAPRLSLKDDPEPVLPARGGVPIEEYRTWVTVQRYNDWAARHMEKQI